MSGKAIICRGSWALSRAICIFAVLSVVSSCKSPASRAGLRGASHKSAIREITAPEWDAMAKSGETPSEWGCVCESQSNDSAAADWRLYRYHSLGGSDFKVLVMAEQPLDGCVGLKSKANNCAFIF
ncbi:MAG: hypothetical protein WCO71_01315 [Pseudomonadota bacterium]